MFVVEKTREARLAIGIFAAVAGVGVMTALLVANHEPAAVTASPYKQPHQGVVLQMQDPASPATHPLTGDDAAGALTLLSPDEDAVVTDKARELTAVVAVPPLVRRPEGQLESVAPGVAHTIERAQILAAPVTDPVADEVASVIPAPGAPPDPESSPQPADCPVLTTVTSVLQTA